ncbi:MAG: glycosyl hydrolase, partial [Vicinamibacteria bacterium]|nr:glycosyl hydrolase [Vicinamibacteria bacterium]
DAGKTWTHVGLGDTHAIGRIRIHPTNPDVVFVAALGHPYGPNEQRGVYRSVDGGSTWTRVLYRSDRVGAVDLALDVNDPQVVYATLWEVHRTPWSLSSGGPGSGLFKSNDGGSTWTELTRRPGLPKGVVGKITVTVSPADSQRVYSLVEADDGGVFRSDDAGATWARMNEERDLRQRAFYFSRIVADPKDRDTVYALNFRFNRSTDGGRTFTALPEPHADHHDLWIDPTNPQRMIGANDGGGSISVNGGQTWSEQNFPTAQMYHVATTVDFPFHACGAQQDNSTSCVPSDGADHLHDPREPDGDWMYAAGGNESGYVVPHPTDPNIFYGGGQEAYLTRYDRRTGQARDIQPYPRLYSGESAGSVPERWNWTFPIAVSKLDPGTVYAGSQHLWRTRNEGQTWEKISPDLTRADPNTLGDSGGPITKDQNGPEFFATIFTIAPSRIEKDTIWVGSDDGRVHLTRDGGKAWTAITPADMPEFTTVSLIEASPHAAGTAFLAGKRYRLDDRAPYAWRTTDYGRTWTRITEGLGASDYVHAIREDRKRPGLLYAGTEHGVHVSFDRGDHWQSLSLNLPDVQVSDLVVEDQDLVIATHGRSFYVLDGIESLRQATPEVMDASVHLFEPGPAYRRARPAALDFLLSSPAKELVIEVLDPDGKVVRRLAGGRPQGAGVNRVTWDLRTTGATVFPGMILRSTNPARGPFVPPATYRVRPTADGVVEERSLVVLKDPRLADVSDEDLREQYLLARRVSDKTSAANGAVIRIREIRKQVGERLKAMGTLTRTLRGSATDLLCNLSAIEEAIYQVKNRSPKDPLNFPIRLNNRIAALQGVIEEADARPTQQAYDVFTELSTELDGHLLKLQAVLETGLAAFNRDLRRVKVAPVAVR